MATVVEHLEQYGEDEGVFDYVGDIYGRDEFAAYGIDAARDLRAIGYGNEECTIDSDGNVLVNGEIIFEYSENAYIDPSGDDDDTGNCYADSVRHAGQEA